MTTDNPMEHLGQDARVLKQARMLPMGRKLTDTEISAVRVDYIQYRKKTGVADATVAKEIGFSQSVVSQFVAAQYLGDNERVARLINDWMERHARRQEVATPAGFVSTLVAQEVQTLVRFACADGCMTAIVSPSGSGKTMLIQVLAESFRGAVIYCEDGFTPVRFVRAVAKTINVSSLGSETEVMDRIVEKLHGTHRPLFLDEAHRLRPQAMSRVRTIYDRTGCPIHMFGTHEILVRINDRANGCGQMASRCLQYSVMEHVAHGEGPGGEAAGRPLWTKQEIQAFLDHLQVKLDPGGFQMAWAVACLPNHGCLRTLGRLVRLLRPNQQDRERVITRQEIAFALQLLFGVQGKVVAGQADQYIRTVKVA